MKNKLTGCAFQSEIRNPKSAIRRGFTLIELLLVLVILATLAAIVVPKLAGRGEDARLKAAAAQISMFETAIEAFRVDNGRMPSTGEPVLRDLVEPPSDCPSWNKEGYLKEVPLDPWGHPYKYLNPGQHNTRGYDLYSAGPDGVDGTPDDIGNWTTPKQ